MKKSILLLTAVALVTFNSAFDFGNDPNKQKFNKMTVMYRDFQGANKEQYKFEEVTKNSNGLIVSHYFYDPAGKTMEGSYSLVYDNNLNIKEKKNIVFDKAKGKDIISKTTYMNSFTEGKIKRAIITEKENVSKNDTVDYIRNSGGAVIEKKSRSNGNGTTVFYNDEGRTEKEVVYTKGKISLTRVFEYGNNGIKQVIGTNAAGKESEKLVYEYNDKGKLIKEDRTFEDVSKNFSAVYKYDAKGQFTVEERNDAGNKLIIMYEYNDKGMISEINVKNDKSIRRNERIYTYE